MRDIHFQKCRAERWRKRNEAVCEFEARVEHGLAHVASRGDTCRHMRQRKLQNTGQCRGGDNSPQNRAARPTRMQDCRRQHADEEHNQIRRGKMRIQLYGRARVFDDHTRLLQSDECNEKPDACRNTILQARADCVENQLAQSDERQD